MNCFRCGWLIVACVFALAPAVLGADKKAVVMRGIYEYSLHPDSPKASFSTRFNFEVYLSDCHWLIAYKQILSPAQTNELTDKSLASFDGTNIFYVEFQDQEVVRQRYGSQYDSIKDQLPAAKAEIFPGNYPTPKEFILQNIWLALASECVLCDSKGLIKPPFLADLAVFDATNNYCAFSYVTNGSAVTPAMMVLQSDGHIYSRNKENGQLMIGKQAYPYDKGYTNGVGLYQQWTNVSGRPVPLRFEFSAFAPKSGGHTAAELTRVYAYSCVVTDVCSATLGPIPPPLPEARVLVTDRRFVKEGMAYVNYTTTNGWLSAEDDHLNMAVSLAPKISPEAEAVRDLGVRPQHHDTKKYLVWGLLVLPLFVFVLKGLSVKRNKNKQ